MADDIQIKSAGGSGGNMQGKPPTPPPKSSTESKPVIDLREMDTTKKAAAKTPQSGVAPGINLEEAAMMEQSQTIAPPQKYAIPTMVKEKFPDLIQLIKETESMNDEERDYWFQILPIMTEEQIKKFRDILLNEKNQLSRLDKDYEQELQKLNEKHLLEWKEFESKEKRKALTEAETKSEAEEKAAEEELLKRLSQP